MGGGIPDDPRGMPGGTFFSKHSEISATIRLPFNPHCPEFRFAIFIKE
jgi:hypothetical protein